MKIKIFILQFMQLQQHNKKPFMQLQQHNRNSGVKLPNCYSHAKFENFLPAIYRDIHHLINVIYYSSVDDVRNT